MSALQKAKAYFLESTGEWTDNDRGWCHPDAEDEFFSLDEAFASEMSSIGKPCEPIAAACNLQDELIESIRDLIETYTTTVRGVGAKTESVLRRIRARQRAEAALAKVGGQ